MTNLRSVKLTMGQRGRAAVLAEKIQDDPDMAAHELIGLRDAAREMNISGQVIIRETGESGSRFSRPGRKCVMIFGILAIPEDSELRGEHQYPVFGDSSNVIRIADEQGADVSQHTIGDTPSGILMQPMWRV